jgi:hypothetical protein
MRLLTISVALGLSSLAFSADEKAWTLDVELGSVSTVRNSVQIRGDTGTRFDFKSLTGSRGRFSGRTTFTYRTKPGPEWRFVYAPLVVSGTGRLAQATNFDGTLFNSNDPTNGRYQFNTYRLTYRNTWQQRGSSRFGIGGTLLVRDAEIRLARNGVSKSSKNVGLVPLLHLFGETRFAQKWSFAGDLDFAAAAQGRAIDLGLNLGYAVNPNTDLTLGFRVLEGGADNDEVYNFSQFHTWFIGARIRF